MPKPVKKVSKKPIAKKIQNIESTTKKLKITKNGIVEVDVVKPEEKKTKSKEKYLKVLITEPRSRFVQIGEMVQRKEIKWVRFCTENNIGVHEFLILN